MTAREGEREPAPHSALPQPTRIARGAQAREQGRRGALAPLGLWALGDAVAGALAFLLALLARYRVTPAIIPRLALAPLRLHLYVAAFWLYVPLLVTCLGLAGAYRRGVAELVPVSYRAVARGATYALLVLLMATYLFDRASMLSRGWLLATWALTIALVAGLRLLAYLVSGRLAAAGLIGRRVLIVGTHDEALSMEWLLRRQRRLGLQVVGFIDDAVPAGTVIQGGKSVVGRTPDLRAVVTRYAVEAVLISARASNQAQMLAVVEATLDTPAEVVVSPDVFTALSTGATVVPLPGMPMVTVSKLRLGPGERLVKALFDRLGAALLLVLLSPLLLVLVAVVRYTYGGVFERYPALGLGGRRFNALKLRTTPRHADAADEPRALTLRRQKGLPVRENPHLTLFGRFLRRSSLDELPQLLNVLRGQMSLVGPYKIAPDDRSHYGTRWLSVLTLKPGITGMAQVHGRGELTMEERSILDAEYVRDYSLGHDLALLLATIPTALRGRGAF